MCSSWGRKKSYGSIKKSRSEVAQSCPTLCDPMDCTLPGSSVHGIFQARVMEWVAISFSIMGALRKEGVVMTGEYLWYILSDWCRGIFVTYLEWLMYEDRTLHIKKPTSQTFNYFPLRFTFLSLSLSFPSLLSSYSQRPNKQNLHHQLS